MNLIELILNTYRNLKRTSIKNFTEIINMSLGSLKSMILVRFTNGANTKSDIARLRLLFSRRML
jgi:hypothetical protein